jgi:fused signal recognition particle receptor
MPQVKDEPNNNSEAASRQRLFGRLRRALKRTRSGLVERLSELFRGRSGIDAGVVEEIETLLIMADVGVEATDRIVDDLATRLARRQLNDPDAVFTALRENMSAILAPVSKPLLIPEQRDRPFVILTVGVNGTGKTTTIGKLAQRFQAEHRSVMLAAGDTFRAAAVEQLQIWGERLGVPVVAQHPGADSASVIYDALQSAQARGVEVLIADTAGRLHTKANLMEELKKVHRVLGKLDPLAPHETLLVVDGGTGQNALAQAREFHQAVGVNGMAITKLDGTAKGGIVFAIAQQLAIPLRFIGVGEGPQDLRPFDAGEFVEALLAS